MTGGKRGWTGRRGARAVFFLRPPMLILTMVVCLFFWMFFLAGLSFLSFLDLGIFGWNYNISLHYITPMVKFRTGSAQLVKLSGSVAIEALASALVDFVKGDVLKSGAQFSAGGDKVDISLVRYICCLIETVVVKKSKTDEKINKRDVALRVYEALAGHQLNDQQRSFFFDVVEDMHSSGTIKPVSAWRRFRKGVSAFLKGLLA